MHLFVPLSHSLPKDYHLHGLFTRAKNDLFLGSFKDHQSFERSSESRAFVQVFKDWLGLDRVAPEDDTVTDDRNKRESSRVRNEKRSVHLVWLESRTIEAALQFVKELCEGVNINIDQEDDEMVEAQLNIRVRDYGGGIKPGMKDQVFSYAFSTVDSITGKVDANIKS
ncbi:hypothetical protein PPACK8108_LOCUS14825 [Phakopsora pachyrhizi]|uniref:Uncharacterized protein n=1 Tax=Phakopsora pachyrhizi TaxID=170000 RepID=A0AAV0B544_PHAPC|nr:hypothetical protein PPACK8108_LOCUS14825 [Phakopsora pachyrhizi]